MKKRKEKYSLGIFSEQQGRKRGKARKRSVGMGILLAVAMVLNMLPFGWLRVEAAEEVTVEVCGHPGVLRDNGDGTHGAQEDVETCPYCGEIIVAAPHIVDGDNVCVGCGVKMVAKVERDGAVLAYIGSSSFNNAFRAEYDGATVVLLEDFKINIQEIGSILVKNTFILDLAGHTITSRRSIDVYQGGNLTIRDTSPDKTGGINGGGAVVHIQEGILRLEGGSFNGEWETGVRMMGGILSVADSDVKISGYEAGLHIINYGNSVVYLSASTYSGNPAILSEPAALGSMLLNNGISDEPHYAYFDKNNAPILLSALQGQEELDGPITVQKCTHMADVCEYQSLSDSATHERTCLACGATGIVECVYDKNNAKPNENGTHTLICVCGSEKTEDCSGGTASYTEKAVCEVCGGVYGEILEDTGVPTGEISIGTNKWNSFLDTITFGLFFKETEQVTVTGEDLESGVASIAYYISKSGMSEEDVKALTEEWTVVNGDSVVFGSGREGSGVVYAKITDYQGNVTYLSSDGMVFDGTLPSITGVVDGETYCTPQTVTVMDENLEVVTVNGKEEALPEGEKTVQFIFADLSGIQMITAADKAGNMITLTVNMEHCYGTEWKSDENEHWHECDICGEKSEVGVHVEDDGSVTKVPTETETGIKTYQCSVCGDEMRTEEIEKLPLSHTHEYGTEWKSDENSHWHECACGEKSEVAAHVENEGSVTKAPTETETGIKTYRCSVCEYGMRTEEIEKLPPSHTHEYGTEWKSDENSHWHECVCGEKSEVAAHMEDGGSVTKAPTVTETGIRTYRCSVCKYGMRTEEIAKLPQIPDSGSNGSGSGGGTSGDSGSGNETPEVPDTPPTEPGEGSGTETTPTDPGTENKPKEPGDTTKPETGGASKPEGGTTDKPETGDTDASELESGTDTETDTPQESITESGKMPFLKGQGGKAGWDVIRAEEKNTENGNTINVDMNGSVTVPGDIFDRLKGRDIRISFDMGENIFWNVDGKSILADKINDIDFSVITGRNNIPEDLIANVAKENNSIQFSLAHEGIFGFCAVLCIPLGKDNAGRTASLYYYNESVGELALIGVDEVAENGSASFLFEHASDYVIVIGKEAKVDGTTEDKEQPKEDGTGTEGGQPGESGTGTDGEQQDESGTGTQGNPPEENTTVTDEEQQEESTNTKDNQQKQPSKPSENDEAAEKLPQTGLVWKTWWFIMIGTLVIFVGMDVFFCKKVSLKNLHIEKTLR